MGADGRHFRKAHPGRDGAPRPRRHTRPRDRRWGHRVPLWYRVAVWTARTIYTWTRYVDWFVSTPAMLVSTALFFHHRRGIPLGDVFDGYLTSTYASGSTRACLGLACWPNSECCRYSPLSPEAGGVRHSFTALATFLGSEGVDTMSVILYTRPCTPWGCSASPPRSPTRRRTRRTMGWTS